MARYESEFEGIPGGFARPGGADPNYGGGYYGMRMTGGYGRAAYGAYRLSHPYDMDAAGGYGGIHGRPERDPYRGYDRGWERRGRVARDYYDPDLLHEYNANSEPPSHRGYDRGWEGGQARDGRGMERSWSPRRDYQPRYGNRGISDAGYGEAWARFPMRGGR